MPPKSVCSFPSCKNIATKNSRCDIHQRELKAKKQSNRSSTTLNEHIYQSTRWRKLPLCEHCLKANVYKPVQIVDHIVEINDDESLAYVYSNLQSLCHSCHRVKTAKAARERKKTTISANSLFEQILKNKEK